MVFKRFRVAPLLFSLALIYGCTAGEFINDPKPTWEQALVCFPDSCGIMSETRIQERLQNLSRRPVMAYMHGSGGLAPDILSAYLPAYAQLLDAVAVAPNSQARSNWTHDKAAEFDPYRIQDISYTLRMLRQQKWADPDNLFLMGQSAGGIAVAGFTEPGFRAAAITGFDCNRFRYEIYLPEDVPVINAQHPGDLKPRNPTLRGGTCYHALRNRPNSEVYEIKGEPVHNGAALPEVREKIVDFFKRNSLNKR